LIVVKRYPNRKLYDTSAKRYVSLDILAGLIRQGEDIQVVDHATGDDLTLVILAQIIAEQERKQGGLLSLPLLTGWIQAGGETLASLRRTMAAQFDIVRQVDEEIARRVASLVSRGDLSEEDGQRLRGLLLPHSAAGLEQVHPPELLLESLRARYGIPSRREIESLSDQLDALSRQVDALHPQNDAEA
jgi:polyhydroxyalkanoate synthesis repressor PhaR